MKSSFSRPWESFKERLVFNHELIENQVFGDDSQTPGLQSEALYSSLEDLWNIFQSPHVRGDLVDLGAGIGIPSLFYGSLFSERKSLGIESSFARFKESVALGQSLNLSNVKFLHENLMSCEIPKAETYYFYFPTGPALDRILFELSKKDHVFTCVVIESHGDLVARFEKESELKLCDKIPLVSKRHLPEAYLFQSCPGVERRPSLHDLSFQEKFLLIDQDWVGESLGLEWQGEDSFNLKQPPRTICENQVSSVLSFDQLPEAIQKLVHLRRLGELDFTTQEGKHHGIIRKIGMTPSFYVELSTGEKLEWTSIKSICWETILCYDSSSHFFFLPLVP